MSEQATVELLKRFLEAFNLRDLEVRGVDLLEFAQGKITRKDSFWKILE